MGIEECRSAARVKFAEQEEKGTNESIHISAREGSSGMHDDSRKEKPATGLRGIDEEQDESSSKVEVTETAPKKQCDMEQFSPVVSSVDGGRPPARSHLVCTRSLASV